MSKADLTFTGIKFKLSRTGEDPPVPPVSMRRGVDVQRHHSEPVTLVWASIWVVG
jgi:hypothetical protein